MPNEDWIAEQDAQTLKAAEIIKADLKRLQSAQAAASRLLEQERESVKVMAKIAKPGHHTVLQRTSGKKESLKDILGDRRSHNI